MLARALAICALCALSGIAQADSAKLAQARQAIAEVRYTDAQALLVAALQDGGNSPVAVAAIYQLLARTATVLHEPDLAQQYYCRWLALEPGARLSDDVSPKLRERFVAAQAFMAANGRLSVKTAHADREIEVVVESDPLVMVAAAALDDGGTPVPIAADHRARLPARVDDAPHAVFVLDEHGNHLLELAPPPAEAATVRAPPPPPPPAPVDTSPSFVRRPLVWAIPAAALLATGAGFALAARSADDELAAIVQHAPDHFYADATPVRDRRDREALVANVAFAAGAACAATAIVMLVFPAHQPPVAVNATPDSIGVVVTRGW